MGAAYDNLLRRCRSLEPVATAVAYPCEATALTSVVEAAKAGLIAPILVGPRDQFRDVAATAGLNIDDYPIEDAEDAVGAAAKAVALVRAAKAEVLMKGSLHTDELMAAVVPSATGLRTGRRIRVARRGAAGPLPRAHRSGGAEPPATRAARNNRGRR